MVRLIRVFDVQDSIPYPFKFFFSLAGLVSSLSLFVHRRPSDFFLRSRYVGFIWRYQAELPGAILLLHFHAM